MRLSAWLTHWDSPQPRPARRALFEGAADEVRDSVLVTEISLEGARLLTPAPLEIGGKVLLQLPMLEPVKARVVWVSNRIAGCIFLRPLHPAVFRVMVARIEGQAAGADG
jgi:hypothetical protein